jgi:hypothetical protein
MHFTLADLITDIAANAHEAEANLIEIEVSEKTSSDSGEFSFAVKDNGKGMTSEQLDRAIDPFVTDGIKHPNRKVGLGLPFLVQTAVLSNGGWDVKSENGKGTTVTGWLDTGFVDTPPVGDIPGMFRSILMFNTPAEIIIRRRKVKDGVEDDYEIIKSELADALGSLEDVGALVLLGEYLSSLENDT